MAFRRRFKRRRRFFRRRSFRRRGPIRRVAHKVRRIERYFETKALTLGATPFTVNRLTNTNFSSQLFALNTPAQGTEFNERIGQKITSKRIHIRFKLESNAQAGSFRDSTFRVMLFWDTQPNALAPALDELFNQSSFTTPNEPDFFAYRQWAWRKRFRFIYDKFFALAGSIITSGANPIATNGTQRFLAVKDIHLRLKNREVQFEGTGGGLVNVTKNTLYVLFSSFSTEDSTAVFASRFTYVDA